MQAVILAAGKGERLWPLTRNTPKCLLELGSGMTLLESQIVAIRQAREIQETTLVLGYLAEQVEAKLSYYVKEGMRLRPIYNPFFDISNNLISLWMAMPHVGDAFVVVNGDDVFNPRVLRGLLEAPSDRDIVMVIDRKESYDQDDMKVHTEGDRVLAVSKEVPLDQTNGESIGMILFRRRGASKLKQTLDAWVRREEGRRVFWLRAVQEIMDEGFPVYFHQCSVEDWAEVDFHPDREFVRANLARFDTVARGWSGKR